MQERYRGNRSFCLGVVIANSLILAASARAGDSAVPLGQGQKCLRLIPQSAASVFCVTSTIRLRSWKDLSGATAFETALCFTTMLVQQDTQLRLGEIRIRCAVSAVRNIRYPKQDASRPVVDGPFQSERCEVFLILNKLPPDWVTLVAETYNLKTIEVAGRWVLEIPLANERLLVTRLADDVICVANHAGFLSELLQLAKADGKQSPASIEANPAFHAAMSCISPTATFWGIRLFRPADGPNDPTSLRNRRSMCSVCDPQAVFVACELADSESSDLQYYYASGDSAAAMKRYPEYLQRAADVRRARVPLVVPPSRGVVGYIVNSMKIDLTKVIIEGMDEPAVLFLAICSEFGQGMML